ncbi:hypothetical protein ACFOY2_16755 [Nonomuraea purpurea]|uniref:SMI1/KNR4 family protein n=1 Tax=Nonomuraea purpurea TaxID=1849276 RepID=A0ABV8G6X5_9ACTN
MTDAYSPIPELNLFKAFVDATGEDFTHWGGLTDYGRNAFLDDPELIARLLPFAYADHGGSLFCLWRLDDRGDLATVPIVLMGHEGGIHLIARDLREFFRFLGALDCPIACDWQYVFYEEEEEEESAAREKYLAWLGEQFGLSPADDPDDVIEAAAAEFQERFDAWILPLVPDAVSTRP